MGFWDDLVYRAKTLGGRGRQELELDEELRFHLEMEIEQRMARGESRREAERGARLDFGTPEAVKDDCREAWGTQLLFDIGRDLKRAWRNLLKERRFSFVVIASLAIGIGAVAVIFSMVDAVMLNPLPFHEPERLVLFWEVTPDGEDFSSSDANLLDFRRRVEGLEGIAAYPYPPPRPALLNGSERLQLSGMAVTPNFFDVLGVEAHLGRTFGEEESLPGSDPKAVVLTHHAWQRFFSGTADVVGQKFDLDGELWAVIGVLPADFHYGAADPDIFLPYLLDAEFERADHRLSAVARLAPGVTLQQADDEVKAVAHALAEEYPASNEHWSATLAPAEDLFFDSTDRRGQWVLLGGAGLLLLLACVNVSSMLMARVGDRAREVQVRLALGAPRKRIFGQLLTESLALSLFGAVAGLGLAALAVPRVRLLEVGLPRLEQMTLDLRVGLVVALAAVVAGLLFGLTPALRLLDSAEPSRLRQRSVGSDRQGMRLRSLLVAGEVALATLLAVAAGLLMRSFSELDAFDPGFEMDGVMLVEIDLPTERYGMESASAGQFFVQLEEKIADLPTVTSVGSSTTSPFRGPQLTNRVADRDEQDQNAFEWIRWRAVTTGHFRTMGVPILRGRVLGDSREGPLEVMISANLAEKLWPGKDPIGEPMRWIRPEGPLFRVVGVVADVQDVDLGEAPPQVVYVPQYRFGWSSMSLEIRSDGPFEPLALAVREAIREVDPLLATPTITSLESRRREALAQPLLSLRLMGIFSAIALVLATMGIYGIVAYAADRRRRELGLRTALGARPADLAGLVLRGSGKLVLAGLAVGLLLSVVFGRTLGSLLYETSPLDPQVLIAVSLVLGTIGLLAAWLPARRAARLDPVKALREE